MSTPVKPPVIVRPKTARTGKKYYTIHEAVNKVFAVKLLGFETLKTSVVSFNNREDAENMSGVLQNHHRHKREWPVFNFEAFQDDNILRVSTYDNTITNNILYVSEWNEMDDLKLFCVSNCLDLIDLYKMNQQKDGFQLKGNVFKFDAPSDFYAERFDYLLDKYDTSS
jgi:CTP:phosphocholine cytidylyltransferase-like protein